MGRLFLLLVFVLIGVWLVRRALARADAPPARARAGETGPVDELVGCARCGVLLPRGEARSVSGAAYCSEEHARLGPRRA